MSENNNFRNDLKARLRKLDSLELEQMLNELYLENDEMAVEYDYKVEYSAANTGVYNQDAINANKHLMDAMSDIEERIDAVESILEERRDLDQDTEAVSK
jgi:hypothetical protein